MQVETAIAAPPPAAVDDAVTTRLRRVLGFDREGGETRRLDPLVRWALWVSSALVVAFLLSLIARPDGSYVTPVDGWGVSLFEVAMSGPMHGSLLRQIMALQ
jgi:hypothetical protein